MSITTYLTGVANEMREIKWPTRRQTIMYTTIVLGLTAFIAAYLGAVDLAFVELIQKVVEFARS